MSATMTSTRPQRTAPSTLALGLSRIGYETRLYFRSPDTLLFTFFFPFIMLGIFTAAFSSSGNIGANPDGTGEPAPVLGTYRKEA